MEVYLNSSLGEVLLGTVEEIIGAGRLGSGQGGIGMSFEAIISDIVANMLPENQATETFNITLR